MMGVGRGWGDCRRRSFHHYISNIYEREDFRKVNYIKDECVASIIGKSLEGYLEAIDKLIEG